MAFQELVERLNIDFRPSAPATIEVIEGGVSIVFNDFPLHPCTVRRNRDGLYSASFGKCSARGKTVSYVLKRLSSKSPLAAAAVLLIAPAFEKITRLESQIEFESIMKRFYAQFRIY
jgi:hypothetical protein